MKIGLIALSGIRVQNEELKALGLTMPGVVERSQVIASMPSLSLLTLAALTPPEFEVCYREVRDLDEHEPEDFDLVALTSFTAQIKEAYALARLYESRGTPVVIGGLHATACPDEAAMHAGTVVVGEGEAVWRRVLADFAAGRLERRYRGGRFDLAGAPVPRYDLLDVDRYNRITVQTQRGCPHHCEFCASSILLSPRYKVKPVERIVAEIRAIKEIWPRPFLELADDNSFCDRRHARALLAALRREKVVWFTETDISIADDPGLIDALRLAGCRQVLVGLESPTATGIRGVELRADWKRRRFERYAQAIHAIQSRGVTVNGCFVLGLDNDTEDVFDAVHEFAERTNLYDVQITVQTPFPGTPLYARLLAEGRILQPGAWERCTLFDVNYEPKHMTRARLEQGLCDLTVRLYDEDAVWDRRRRFFRALGPRIRRDAPALEAG